MTDERMPWYQWLVLASALAMSAPGEYDLAVAAGWVPAVAWVMPVVVSVYGAVAAYAARKVPKGTPARRSAVAGALAALVLALAFQVTAHLMAAGYVHESAWLVAAVSATPPVVVAHLMHMPHPTARVAGSSAAATVKKAKAMATSEAGGHPAGTAAGTEAVADGPGAAADSAAVNGSPTAATVAADESAAIPESVAAAAAAAGGRLVDVATQPVATEAVAREDTCEPDTLPGLALVASDGQPAAASSGRGHWGNRGRSVPDAATIRAAMADLEARGVTVTGETLGAHFGVAARTGRRYMANSAA